MSADAVERHRQGGQIEEVASLRRDAKRNRQRILAAAREVFAEEGLNVALEQIARRAGLGIGTLYRRFPDREALIDGVFEGHLQQILTLAEESSRDEDAWRGLVQFMEGMSRMQLANRGLNDLVIGNTRGRERSALLRDRLDPLLDELLTRAQEQGTLRSDVTTQDLPLIGAMIGGVIDITASVAPDMWYRYLRIVLDGLRSERSGPSALPLPSLRVEQLSQAMRQHNGSQIGPARHSSRLPHSSA
jgi:AcrR family transcriptional regulator